MSLLIAKPHFTDLRNFLNYTKTSIYPPKFTIFNEGDHSEKLYYIINGSISVVLEDDNNREIIISYLNPGDFFGEISLFDVSQARSASIRTREKSELAEITYEDFRTYANLNPEILYLLGKQMARRLRLTTQKVADLSFLDATGRLASALLELSRDPSAMTHPDGMQIKITRQDLGKISNCSREMVGRILKDMEGQGLIKVTGKTLVIYGTR
tara:strand:+ start:640 stop:1275 length:636 start_codon:yes stop_codon:yes gene_type:complete